MHHGKVLPQRNLRPINRNPVERSWTEISMEIHNNNVHLGFFFKQIYSLTYIIPPLLNLKIYI